MSIEIKKPSKGATPPYASASNIEVTMGGNYHNTIDPGHTLKAAAVFPHE